MIISKYHFSLNIWSILEEYLRKIRFLVTGFYFAVLQIFFSQSEHCICEEAHETWTRLLP